MFLKNIFFCNIFVPKLYNYLPFYFTQISLFTSVFERALYASPNFRFYPAVCVSISGIAKILNFLPAIARPTRIHK